MQNKTLDEIARKIKTLNSKGVAVIFIVTGPNGSGKTVIAKKLLTDLPFHQSYNLGVVAKTIRYIFNDAKVTRLENFTNEKITSLFTPIIQFACKEYSKNGVNVVIDGVQIDTDDQNWLRLVSGGVVLTVNEEVKLTRNQFPETHFKRQIELSLSDNVTYPKSPMFTTINNSGELTDTYKDVLVALKEHLDKAIKNTDVKGSVLRVNDAQL